MKIIIAHKYWYPRDGSTTHVFDLAKLLTDHGHTVIPFAMSSPNNVYSPFAEFFVSEKNFFSPKGLLQKIRLFFAMVYSFEAKKKFHALVTKERPDIVHIHNIYHHISPSILDVCERMNIPIVQTVHDYKLVCSNYKLFANGATDEGCLKGNYFHDAWNRSVKGSVLGGLACAIEMSIHRAFGFYTKGVRRFIVPSKCVEEKLVQGGYAKERISVIPHFVFEKVAPERVSASYDIEYVLCVGRLSEEKGFDIAIQAMKDLLLPLIIAGEGPARAVLEKQAATLGIADRVHFVGFQSRESIRKLMASATAVLIPSLWHEPFCYVVSESFLAHTLPIGSDIGALKELLGGVSDRLLVPPGNPVALAGRISELLGDKVARERLIERGIKIYQERCAPETYYDSLMNVYRSAIKELNT